MAQLAIKGHPTRGKEVIKILEMLGGKNIYKYSGQSKDLVYFINCTYNYGSIGSDTESDIDIDSYKLYSLEDFLEKYPFKVGDKVITIDKFIRTITDIRWQGDSFFIEKEEDDIVYTVQVSTNVQITYTKEDLQPYKGEIMEEKIESFEILESHCKDEVKIEFDTSKFEMIERENGYYVVRKKPKYPKTYDECCEVFGLNHYLSINWNNYDLAITTCVPKQIDDIAKKLKSLNKLIICRDAYWKIAGEEMGLCKPWEPDWKDCTNHKYTIHLHCDGHIFHQDVSHTEYRWLSFPTAEMRDDFYENFKDLIKECKELL